MINETALICGGFLSPLCKDACNPVFLIKLEQDRGRGGKGRRGEGRGGEGRGKEGKEGKGAREVCVRVCL